MKITWILCILISLALHMGYLARSRFIRTAPTPPPTVPIIIAPQELPAADLPEPPLESVASDSDIVERLNYFYA